MRQSLVTLGIPGLAAGLALVALVSWLRFAAAVPALERRTPIAQTPVIAARPAGPRPRDPAPAPHTWTADPTTPEARPTPSVPTAAPTSAPTPVPVAGGNWPAFRGPDRDNINKEAVPLNRDWEKHPPAELWAIADLAEGYAAPAVADGRVFLLDYDQTLGRDHIRCFGLADGKPLWDYAYPVEVKGPHGKSRTVPAVWQNLVVTLGPRCQVYCFDAATGTVRWNLDLVKEYGTVVPEWHAGQCPLLDDGKLILAPGGTALLLALDPATGKVLWQTPNPHALKMSHSSVMPWGGAGRPMYVYVTRSGVVGVDAADGRLLWEYTEWPTVIADIAAPLPVGDNRLFLARGYEQGARLIAVELVAGQYQAKLVKKLPRKVFGSDQQTPIFYQGFIYGVRPPRGELVCLDAEGHEQWASGPKTKFGLGPYLIADGVILVMDDNGTITMATAAPNGYRELTKRKILSGNETWGPLALAGGRLLVRDLQAEKPNSSRLVCLDVRAPD